MLQTAVFDGVSFDPFSFEQNGMAAPEVDVGRCQVAEAFVRSATIVMIGKGCDL